MKSGELARRTWALSLLRHAYTEVYKEERSMNNQSGQGCEVAIRGMQSKLDYHLSVLFDVNHQLHNKKEGKKGRNQNTRRLRRGVFE